MLQSLFPSSLNQVFQVCQVLQIKSGPVKFLKLDRRQKKSCQPLAVVTGPGGRLVPGPSLLPARPLTHPPPLLLLCFLPLPGLGLLGPLPPAAGPASGSRDSMATSQHLPFLSYSTYLEGQGKDQEETRKNLRECSCAVGVLTKADRSRLVV